MTKGVVAHTECNLACDYCYATQGESEFEYELDAILSALDEWKEKFPNEEPGLHGGEPLMLPNDDLRRLFEKIESLYGSGGWLQTNATLIDDELLNLFDEFDVSVGVSLDGPGGLNEARVENEAVTREIEETIEALYDRGLLSGLIVVLNELNAGSRGKVSSLLGWVDRWCERGVSGHYNAPVPVDGADSSVLLSPERLGEVYVQTYEWMIKEEYRVWNPMAQMQDELLGLKDGSCVLQECDPLGTRAAPTITSEGEFTVCGRLWDTWSSQPLVDEFDSESYRYELLRQVPREVGGCRGCRFWPVCHGGCPAASSDPRNRTRWCKAYQMIFERIERELSKQFSGFESVAQGTDDPVLEIRRKLE